MRFLVVTLFLAAVAARRREPDRCTAIVVGAKASTTGSPLTTQTNDCSSCDFRAVKIPPQTYGANATRPIWPAVQYFPRYVGTARGAAEYGAALLPRGYYNWSETMPVGSIPQVASTFGYIEGVYGIANDHGVAIGESTCTAQLWAKPIYDGGKALLDIVELSRIALERSTTARDAIAIIGALAETYGYYGGFWTGTDEENQSEAGEALTITDHLEAWVFHILPDDTGASAVWVAQKVPSSHVAAVANAFVIHAVDLADTDNFLSSDNLLDVARRTGLWDDRTPFDFTRVFAKPPSNPWYSTRRQWRVLTLANPELPLPPTTDAYGSNYPMSAPTGALLSPHDLMRIQRDHYEGTRWDLTQGAAAGPYGNPDRYETGTWGGHEFERAISIFRASYSYVAAVAATPAASVLWFGPYAPHATLYTPLYPAASTVPAAVSSGSLLAYNASSFFWAAAVVGNTAAHFYKFAHPVVASAQTACEAAFANGVATAQAHVRSLASVEAIAAFLAAETTANVATAHTTATSLFGALMTRFHDGYVVSNFSDRVPVVEPMGYPDWWLRSAGYYPEHQSQYLVVVVWVAIVLSAALGFLLGQRSVQRRRSYAHIK
ncbi:peptidase [Achlya hypogyna]|uniref:Peptidase n=1 Tax=Achlya hypogyna TaxID=1202772 RepID=A0A1V9ZRH3_ACHHY|nr:peptidase [Achlya hypogyna]